MDMPKAIIFDVGGVLISDLFERYDQIAADRIGVSLDDFRKMRKKHWGDCRLGKIHSAEFWRRILSEFSKEDMLKDVVKGAYKVMKINRHILVIVKKLAKSGRYKLGVVSNNSFEWSHYAKSVIGLGKYFSVWISSSDVGMKKPDKEIFLLASDRLGVSPKDCIFIDNSKTNVAGAVAAGLTGIHYTTPSRLLKELRDLGIVV